MIRFKQPLVSNGLRAILLIVSFFILTPSHSQNANPGIFFQAIARDNYSNPAKDRNIYVESSIIQYSATGTKVLTELHKTTTDGSGVFSISVGNGTRISGSAYKLSDIEWPKGPYYLGLKIAIQPVSPIANWDYTKELIDLGASPFGTVPYALYAGNSGSIDGKLNISDTTNMLAPYRQLIGTVAANSSNVNTAAITKITDGKLNIADSISKYVTPTQLAAKTFDSTAIYNQFALKANNTDITNLTTILNSKANIADVTTALTTKANVIDVSTALNVKANTASVTSSLATKEDLSNKSTNVTTDATSDIKYPSVKAIKNYVDAQVTSATTIVDGSITDAKIASVSGSKISGNITGNATNVTGIVGVANGGTGASNAAAARTNLGLAIGTNVQAPLTFNTPIVTNGNTISLNKVTTSVDGYLSAADFTNFNNKIDATQKAANNGVATLGNDGKIPSNQIPAISFQSANVVNNPLQMLQLSNAVVGSIAIRTDVNENYVLSALPASTQSNWIRLLSPTSVTSVNGNAGPNVVLTSNDVAEGSTNKYYTDARARAAMSATAPLSYNSSIGTISMTAASASTNGYLSSADFTTFNNKQNILTAGADYLAPNGSAALLTNFPTLNQSTTGNAATATKLATARNINGVAFDGSANITVPADGNTLTGSTLASGITSSSLTSVGTITTGVWSGTTIAITKGGTGATNAAAALTNLGAEPTINKSTATDLGSTSPSDILFPSQKAVKTYVDLQSANAGVADGSITNAKLNGGITYDKLAGNIPASKLVGADITTVGTITSGVWSGTTIDIAHGGTGATTAAGARTNLGLVIGTNVMAANAITTLTGDVTGAGNGSIATTVNSIGGVSSATIATLPTSIAANTSSITSLSNSVAANTASITSLNTSVAANTASITSNTNSIATLTTNVNANTNSITALTNSVAANTSSITSLNTSVAANTASITSNTNSIVTLNTSVNANTNSITALTNSVAANTSSITSLNTSVAANTASITQSIADINLKAPIASPNLTGTPTAPTATAGTNTTQLATTAFVNAAVSNYTPTTTLNLSGGVAGNILYQTAPGTTGFIPNGTANQFLTSTGSGTYTWTAASNVTGNFVPYTGATGAVNLGAYDLTVNGLTVGKGSGADASNTAVGKQALYSNVVGGGAPHWGTLNTAYGTQSLYSNISGFSNTAIGNGALKSNTTGSWNVGLGYNALTASIGGGSNVGLGTGALDQLTAGSDNIAIGTAAGRSYGAGSNLTTVNSSIFMGTDTKAKASAGTNEIVIGYSTTGNGSNTVTIGNASVMDNYFKGNINLTGNVSGGTWSGTVIANKYGGAGITNGILKANGTGVVSAAISGTDYLVPNAVITAATKTKITYDANGLVTAGADATTADIAASTNRNYVTDAQAGVISNTSGINTGDETASTIKTKLGILTLSGSNTGDQTITLTNDVSGSGTGSFATTVNSVGGVSSATIATLPTSIAANTSSITSLTNSVAANTSSITSLTNSVATNTTNISANTNSITSLTASVNTLTGNITATTNNYFTSIPNLSQVGTITSGVWSGTTIDIAHGGTGATTAAGARTNLGLVIGTNVLAPNAAISAATKTKITYDANGLVTAGADATTADIASSTNRNYVTDAQAGVISNTSGINTGDETTSTIKTKLGITTLSGSNTGDQTITLTGDVTGTGTGTFTSTLANTGVAANTYGSATLVPVLTVDTKGRITSASTIAINGGVNTLTSIAASSNVNGATISGTALTLTPADASNGGVVTTAAQTFAGAKTFNADIIVNGVTIGNGKNNLTDNTIIGNGAFANNSAAGIDNTVVGYNALKSSTSGNNNTVVGSQALSYGTSTGSGNSALGYAALYQNTTGYGNTAIGESSLYYNTTGYNNVAIGQYAIKGYISNNYFGGNDNIGIGKSALSQLFGGSYNIGIGSNALSFISNGNNNIGIGYHAGLWYGANSTTQSATSLANSIFIGHDSRPLGSSDVNQIVIANSPGALGSGSYGQIGLGSHSTLIGNNLTQLSQIYGALTVVPNTALTNTAGANSTIAAQNATTTNYAGGALNLTAGNGVGTGNGGNVNITPGTTGTGTTGIINLNGQVKITGGSPSAGSVLTSDANGLATWSSTSGSGVSTLTYTSATSYSTGGTISGSTLTLAAADASNPGLISTGSQTIAGTKTFNSDLYVNGARVGLGNGNLATNTALGVSALNAASAGSNTAIGYYAMYTNAGGTTNTAVGSYALKINSTGSRNTALGDNTLNLNTASDNTAIGSSALKNNTTGAYNVAVGTSSIFYNQTGSNNTALGYQSLYSNSAISTNDNTAIGYITLAQNATGSNNTVVGSNAGYRFYGAAHNVAVGYASLSNNNNGNYNTALGDNSGPATPTYTSNNSIFIGASAIPKGVAASTDEIVIGANASGLGTKSTLIGNTNTQQSQIYGALTVVANTAAANMTGTSSTIAAQNATTATYGGGNLDLIAGNAGTTGLGGNINLTPGTSTTTANNGIVQINGKVKITGGSPAAGSYLTSDASGLATWTSVTAGVSTLTYTEGTTYAKGATMSGTTLTLAAADVSNPGLISASNQTFGGVKTFNNGISTNSLNFSDTYNIPINGGFYNNSGQYNIGLGWSVLNSSNTGSNNIGIGYFALNANSSGNNNLAFGYNTMKLNTTGYVNVGIGNAVLSNNTSGNNNVSIGHSSLNANTTGGYNTAIGAYAMANNTSGGFNTAVGQGALNNNDASSNDAFGYSALNYNTSGQGNAAFGNNALTRNTTGNNNVGLGHGALNSLTTSSANVAVGSNAGAYLITDASNYGGNVFIGNDAGTYLPDGTSKNTTGYNSIYIGRETTPLANAGYNEIIIGNKVNPATSGGQVGAGSNSTTIGNSNTTKAIIYASSSLSNLPATATSGNGGDFTLKAQNAYTTGNNNGGNIILTPGTANGSGSAGKIKVNGDLNVTGTVTLASLQGTPIGSVTQSSGAFTSLTASTITAGSINNTTIGDVTQSSGAFTYLYTSGGISVSSSSAAAANTNGSDLSITAQNAGSGGTIGGNIILNTGTGATTTNNGTLMINTITNPLVTGYSKSAISVLAPSGQDGVTIKHLGDGNNFLNLWQTGTTNANMIAFHKGTSTASVVGTINVSTTATTYNTTSDYRLKTDFKDFNAAILMDSIKVYDYQWKINGSRSYGVKAHELQSVLPYAVTGEKDAVNPDGSINPQTVDYSKIVPILIKAIQEQKIQIKEKQDKIETLELRIKKIEEKLNQ